MQSIDVTAAPQVDGQSADKNHANATKHEKSISCPTCNKQFARVEHVQRHIRTHTKERPFQCDICPKCFTRKDLLRRHERLVHSDEDTGENVSISAAGAVQAEPMSDLASKRPRLANSGVPLVSQGNESFLSTSAGMSQIQNGATAVESWEIPQAIQISYFTPSDAGLGLTEPVAPPMSQNSEQIEDLLVDFTMFMDQVGFSEDWDSVGLVLRDNHDITHSQLQNDATRSMGAVEEFPESRKFRTGLEEDDEFSRFASRLPSLQPDGQEQDTVQNHDMTERTSQTSSWTVNSQDRASLLATLAKFDHVLPPGFSIPSRETLTRLLSGYFQGFDEHLPFIHLATFSFRDTAPELILALCMIGAYYKFERQRCLEFFYAAKAVSMEQIRLRDNRYMSKSTPGTSGMPNDTVTSPYLQIGAHKRFGFDPSVSGIAAARASIQTVQALILLMAFSSWQSTLVHEALSFQSIVARLVREHGLSNEQPVRKGIPWEEWARYENDKRTKIVAYCFFNLQTIAFNTPPLIHSEELKLYLPYPADYWKAQSATEWNQITEDYQEVAFQDAFVALFDKNDSSNHSPVTPFGNYVLIHAVLQQIFLSHRLRSSFPGSSGGLLRTDDLMTLERALKRWKALWKRAPDSHHALNPRNPNGPVAFTSTALLGLAYVRLHTGIGPIRQLEAQDPVLTAQNLHDAPQPPRTSRITVALLHSAHALSIPVKLGVNFVAETQTLFWSIQHSLCSMECAFLLAKWLISLSFDSTRSQNPLTAHERRLFLWVYRMTKETEFAVNLGAHHEEDRFESCFNEPNMPRGLAVAVLKIWARTFQGPSKWQIVDLIGKSLDKYANLIERESPPVSYTRGLAQA